MRNINQTTSHTTDTQTHPPPQISPAHRIHTACLPGRAATILLLLISLKVSFSYFSKRIAEPSKLFKRANRIIQPTRSKAKYGDKLLVNLSKDLTRLQGKGFSKSNLVYMRKLYLSFPKSETLFHQLTWSHYFELLKCDDGMEMQFYMKECINKRWSVRELKRQINSSLFQRLALSTDKADVLTFANEGHQVMIQLTSSAIHTCWSSQDYLNRSVIRSRNLKRH
ncbi:MAG: DUF1016 N-terminal domain-containing protein [Bacteroidaceae bacterium]|nr:DUF1016 N-terminal domain-containing protein [Bacteroidaceae bacterium]